MAKEDNDGEHSPSPIIDTEVGHPKGTRSAARKHHSSSQTTYIVLVVCNRVLCFKFVFFDFDFYYFLNTAAKMPRITSSGDNVAVGKIVPSTATDSSKETGTTRAASSSNTSDAGNTGGNTVIVRPHPKFGVTKLAVVRASS